MKNNVEIEKIETHVFEGIRKTIMRFREKPFHYFTEADIHSSLLNDMLEAGAKSLKPRVGKNKDIMPNGIEVSLFHQEYPTNFRYKKDLLYNGYGENWRDTIFNSNNRHGDRGNFDLAVLHPAFLNNMVKDQKLLEKPLKQVINKDFDDACKRLSKNKMEFYSEVLYAIEVKFLHPFNARNSDMIREVVQDNEKLRLAYENSNGFVKPINLVFCSSSDDKRRKRDNKPSVICKLREYIGSGKVIDYQGNKKKASKEVQMVFIEAALSGMRKITSKPLAFDIPNNAWAKKLRNELNTVTWKQAQDLYLNCNKK